MTALSTRGGAVSFGDISAYSLSHQLGANFALNRLTPLKL